MIYKSWLWCVLVYTNWFQLLFPEGEWFFRYFIHFKQPSISWVSEALNHKPLWNPTWNSSVTHMFNNQKVIPLIFLFERRNWLLGRQRSQFAMSSFHFPLLIQIFMKLFEVLTLIVAFQCSSGGALGGGTFIYKICLHTNPTGVDFRSYKKGIFPTTKGGGESGTSRSS